MDEKLQKLLNAPWTGVNPDGTIWEDYISVWGIENRGRGSRVEKLPRGDLLSDIRYFEEKMSHQKTAEGKKRYIKQITYIQTLMYDRAMKVINA